MPSEPPPEPFFRAWVEQSINKAAWLTNAQIVEEVRLANCLSASYLTTSSFVNKMMQVAFPARDGEGGQPVSAVLNVRLPCLPQVDIRTLMKMRNEESDAFHLFRTELARRLGELKNEKDPEQLRTKANAILQQLTECEMLKVELAIKHLQKVLLAKTAAVVGALAATVQSHGVTLPLVGAAAASGYASYREYRAKVSENPMFFLWKVLNKS